MQYLRTYLAILLLLLPSPVTGLARASAPCGEGDTVCCCAGDEAPSGPVAVRTCACAEDTRGAPERSPVPDRTPTERTPDSLVPVLAGVEVASATCTTPAAFVRVLEVPPPPRIALLCVLRL